MLWDARLARCVEDPRMRCAAGDLSQCVAVAERYRDRTAQGHDSRLAITYYQRACSADEASACGALGEMALTGESGARDLTQARRFLGLACTKGHAPSCTRLAEIVRRDGDVAKASELWSTACSRGDDRACTWLLEQRTQATERCDALGASCRQEQPLACALLVQHTTANECALAPDEQHRLASFACEHDEPEGCFQWARTSANTPGSIANTLRDRLTWACEGEHRGACALLSMWLRTGVGGPASEPLSLRFAQRACDLGDIRACAEHADMLVAGSRSREHETTILAGLQRACDAALPGTCVRLGDLRLRGLVVTRDDNAAERSYLASCSQTEALGCERLADLHGYRAAQSEDEGAQKVGWLHASEWLQRACQLGQARACVRSGLLAIHGINGDASGAHAAMLDACSRGAPEGCLYAGRQLALGHGVTADTTRAIALLQQACSAGSVLACGDYDGNNIHDKLASGPVYPRPYAPGVAVPSAHRREPAATSEPASSVPEPAVPTTTARQVVASHHATGTPSFDLAAELGFTGQNNGQAVRLIVDANARLTETVQLRMRIPMVVADAMLRLDADGNALSSASTFRLGNVTLGASHTNGSSTSDVTYRADMILPLALAPDDQEEVPPNLERQLAVRAYQLAAAIDGARSAWLYRPNQAGAVVGMMFLHSEPQWRLDGSLQLAAMLPVRGELDGELIAQLDFTAGRRVGPATFALQSTLTALSDAESYVPSFTALVAVEDRSQREWSLRATWLPVPFQWDVPTWSVSIAFSRTLR